MGAADNPESYTRSRRVLAASMRATNSRWRSVAWLSYPVVCWMVGRDNRKRLSGLKRGVEEMGLIGQVGVASE